MKVVWHDHEFMQEVFILSAVRVKNINEQSRHLVRLKDLSSQHGFGGNEIGAGGIWNVAPQGLKPIIKYQLNAGLKACSTRPW